MRERVQCELPLDAAPKPATLEQWEMDEQWVVVTARGLRALGFARTNARVGEKVVGAMVIFQAAEVREATQDERTKLQEARKADKLQAKQRRASARLSVTRRNWLRRPPSSRRRRSSNRPSDWRQPNSVTDNGG
jgi:hypothetical protein